MLFSLFATDVRPRHRNEIVRWQLFAFRSIPYLTTNRNTKCATFGFIMSQIITLAYRGYTIRLRYSSRANGRRVRGYVTSYSQLIRKLRKHFGKHAFDLYHVQSRRLCKISSDDKLRRAMACLPDGGTLLVKAYEYK